MGGESINTVGYDSNTTSQHLELGDSFNETVYDTGEMYYSARELRKLLQTMITDDDLPHASKITLSIFFAIIISGAVVGNVTLIFAVTTIKEMKTVTNFFLVSLGLSDLLIAVCNMPFTWYVYLNNDWQLGDALCKLSAYLQGVTVASSILTLTAVAIDRYCAVCRPTRYASTRSRSPVIILCIWLSALLCLSPQLLINRVEPKVIIIGSEFNASLRKVNVCVEYFNVTSSPWAPHVYTFAIYVTLYCVPLCLMAVLYGSVINQLWSRRLIKGAKTSSKRSEARLIKNKKVIFMLVLIVAGFACCWMPLFTLQAINLYHDLSNPTMILAITCLAYVNCALNPAIYLFLNDTVKENIKKYSSRRRSRLASRKTSLEMVFEEDGRRLSKDQRTINGEETTASLREQN